jgi:hypothetical protein
MIALAPIHSVHNPETFATAVFVVVCEWAVVMVANVVLIECSNC